MNGSRQSASNPWALVSVNAEAPYGDHVVLVAADQSRGIAYFAVILGGTERCVAGRCRVRGAVKALTGARAARQLDRIRTARFGRADAAQRCLNELKPLWSRWIRPARVGAISSEQLALLVARCANEATRLLKDCHLAK